MHRPKTIPGLVRSLIAVSWAARLTALLSFSFVAVVLAVVLWPTSEPTTRRVSVTLVARPHCPLETTWVAGVQHYDYLQRLSLGADGRGQYEFGYAQFLRDDLRFRYRVRPDNRLEIFEMVSHDPYNETDTPVPGTLRARYTIEVGDYSFEPPYQAPRTYRCRLRLDPHPFGEAWEQDYFSGER
jgi:hypothetical protein